MGDEEVTPPVYDERGNVRPHGTPGARPMSYAERVEIARQLSAGEQIVTSAEKPDEVDATHPDAAPDAPETATPPPEPTQDGHPSPVPPAPMPGGVSTPEPLKQPPTPPQPGA